MLTPSFFEMHGPVVIIFGRLNQDTSETKPIFNIECTFFFADFIRFKREAHHDVFYL